MAPATSPPSARAARAARSPASPRGSWLLPPLLLAATLTGIVLVLRGPDRIFGWTLAAFVGLAILWVLVSALTPARADRTCPRCGMDTLERLDAASTEGLRCRGCGWTDESESSFLLAEEEGVPLEPLVLRERREVRERAAAPGKPEHHGDAETGPR